MDWGSVVNAVLFALFSALTAILNAVTGPTYDNLFVPEMASGSLYAPYLGPGSGGNLFSEGAAMSNYLLVNVVDPVAVLVILGVGILYLIRAGIPQLASKWTDLTPRLGLGILLANMVLPITSVLWSVAGAVYPVFAGYGGGEWRSYTNLVGPGALSFSWDNGALAFVGSLTLFSLVLVLCFLIAFRDAIVAVLLVLLPPLTLLWPIPSASNLARRAWKLFAEMTFLPSLLVVPLALAVGAQSILLVVALFAVAAGMPVLVTQVGGSLSSAGFPHSGSVVSGGILGGARSAGSATSVGLQMGGKGLRSGFSGESVKGGAARVAGGPAALTGQMLWGVGQGLGRMGRQMAHRRGSSQGERSSPPAAAGRAREIAA